MGGGRGRANFHKEQSATVTQLSTFWQGFKGFNSKSKKGLPYVITKQIIDFQCFLIFKAVIPKQILNFQCSLITKEHLLFCFSRGHSSPRTFKDIAGRHTLTCDMYILTFFFLKSWFPFHHCSVAPQLETASIN